MIITFNNNDRRNRPDCPAKANEWGKRYQFWSCADVDIMPPNNFAQVLSSGSSTGSFIFQIIDISLGPKINYFAPGVQFTVSVPQTCSGHGRAFSGRCRCDRNYYGDVCQHQVRT